MYHIKTLSGLIVEGILLGERDGKNILFSQDRLVLTDNTFHEIKSIDLIDTINTLLYN